MVPLQVLVALTDGEWELKHHDRLFPVAPGSDGHPVLADVLHVHPVNVAVAPLTDRPASCLDVTLNAWHVDAVSLLMSPDTRLLNELGVLLVFSGSHSLAPCQSLHGVHQFLLLRLPVLLFATLPTAYDCQGCVDHLFLRKHG